MNTKNVNQDAKSSYLVKCNLRYSGIEYPTISEALDCNHVVIVTKTEDGLFEVLERCDDYHACYLSREQLLAWADELRQLANAEVSHAAPPAASDKPTVQRGGVALH